MRLYILIFVEFTFAWKRDIAEEVSAKAFSCHCRLRDEFKPAPPIDEPIEFIGEPETTTSTTPRPTTLPPTPISRFREGGAVPSRFWSLYSSQFKPDGKSDILSSSFLDKVLGVFRRRIVTTPSPLRRLHMDAVSDAKAAVAGLGRRLITKYFGRLRGDWNLLDRFTCHCDGDLLDVLQARNFVTLSVLHD